MYSGDTFGAGGQTLREELSIAGNEACELLLQFGSSQAIDDAELDRLATRFNLELQNEEIESQLSVAAVLRGQGVPSERLPSRSLRASSLY
jgi:hypothetical protein